MIDKRFSVIYSVLFSLCISIMFILMILLFIEYRFFCRQAQEMVELKQQYVLYVDLLNKKINGDSNALEDIEHEDEVDEDDTDLVLFDEVSDSAPFSFYSNGEEEIGVKESPIAMQQLLAAEASDAPDDDDDYADDSFVVINRQPDYLKQSTLDYMQSQEMNSLMTAIDIDRWSDYNPTVAMPTKKVGLPKKGAVKSPATPKRHIMTTQRTFKDCGFLWPIDADKFWLSSLFGPRKRHDGTWGFHHGIDMAAVKGTPVKAARAGIVVEACFQTGYGNTVVVQHSDILKTRYAHLHTIRAYVGQKVKQGVIVGTVGETGFIRKKGKDGSHLHFEVYEKGKRVNPMHCLPRSV